MRNMLFSLLRTINNILYDVVRKFVRHFHFFLIITLFALVLNYNNKLLLVYQWVQTVQEILFKPEFYGDFNYKF